MNSGPTLSVGTSGDDVRRLQRLLVEMKLLDSAGIDVYEREPDVHPRLLAAPHTVLLPHVGSATKATRAAMTRLAATAIVGVLAGERPPNLVVAPPAGSWP